MNYLDELSIGLDIDGGALIVAVLIAVLAVIIVWPLESKIRIESHDELLS